MTEEVRDESKIEARLEEMQRGIADLHERVQVIAQESDDFLQS